MDYESRFRQHLEALHAEGRYRVFADLKRRCGAYPRANHFRGDEVSELARIDDAEPIGVPTNWVADFADPPVHVFTETNNAPIEDVGGLGHETGFELMRKGSRGAQVKRGNESLSRLLSTR